MDTHTDRQADSSYTLKKKIISPGYNDGILRMIHAQCQGFYNATAESIYPDQ